jgi:hypothetical protein
LFLDCVFQLVSPFGKMPDRFSIKPFYEAQTARLINLRAAPCVQSIYFVAVVVFP